MNVKAEKVVKEALKLPKEERAFVAEKLLKSLDFEEPFSLSPEWQAEILRRCRELDEGKLDVIPSEQVLREVEGSLK